MWDCRLRWDKLYISETCNNRSRIENYSLFVNVAPRVILIVAGAWYFGTLPRDGLIDQGCKKSSHPYVLSVRIGINR